MPRTRYTPEQRQAALDLYTSVGPTEAASRTGIAVGTIASWAARAGLQTNCNETRRVNVEAVSLSFEQRRQSLAHALLEDVDRLRRQMFAPAKVHHFDKDGGFHKGELDEPTFSDKKAIGTTVAILIDKVQLLTGQATGRVEHEHTSKLDQDIEALAVELAANDPVPVEAGA